MEKAAAWMGCFLNKEEARDLTANNFCIFLDGEELFVAKNGDGFNLVKIRDQFHTLYRHWATN